MPFTLGWATSNGCTTTFTIVFNWLLTLFLILLLLADTFLYFLCFNRLWILGKWNGLNAIGWTVGVLAKLNFWEFCCHEDCFREDIDSTGLLKLLLCCVVDENGSGKKDDDGGDGEDNGEGDDGGDGDDIGDVDCDNGWFPTLIGCWDGGIIW